MLLATFVHKACAKALGQVVEPVKQSLTSLGIVSNFSAARLDLWWLMVMAYSNGSCSQFPASNDGGYRATLTAKNFILTISQSSVNVPVIGKLESQKQLVCH